VKQQYWLQKQAGPGHAWICPVADILRATNRSHRGQNWYSVDADWGVLDGVHIGATWRMRLNRPCVAVM